MSCEARQYNDQMLCGRCGMQWDVAETERPECLPRTDRRVIPHRGRTISERRREGAIDMVRERPVDLPLELPGTWAASMADAYERAIDARQPLLAAMQEAYQVLREELLR